ncbi:MAG: hypothetical protein WC812_02720 [Candidatus Pacearchaeota archaeon]|jgi:hypothetical protein
MEIIKQVEICDWKGLNYEIALRAQGGGRSFVFANILDGFFLLNKRFHMGQVEAFGIAKDIEEADKRLYNKAKEIAQIHRKEYETAKNEENYIIEIVDLTKRGKLEKELEE